MVAVVGNRPLVFLVAEEMQMVQTSPFRQPLSLFKIFFRADLKSRSLDTFLSLSSIPCRDRDIRAAFTASAL